ncbi:DUF2285 domain-containing protein [Bradyrhizobium sp. CER78]|uniref:DUF2285 domain-containing protein n=1 Tax=Bradyrhizobium sp. CER78 TaxID=3039162 RepID=UPI002449C842|nr:DUF2285 domain-containing protein [Bradyrhizobium sp. CER78]MDH2380727.1 DUF2285 domain-containing protein [Bradyrhizobium sp. CER78]
MAPQSLSTIVADDSPWGLRLDRQGFSSPWRNAGAAGGRDAIDAYDSSDWAWEFLRRNPDYAKGWRASVPRHLPCITLSDGTRLLRLRRRYPHAERWGLYAFADPRAPARAAPVFWLASANRRRVRARCRASDGVNDGRTSPLATFKVDRAVAIGADGIAVVMLKGQGMNVAVELHDVGVLTRPSRLVFELDGLDDLNSQTERLRTLQRFERPETARTGRSPFANDERLYQALIALDESMAGKTYRQIAIAIFGEQRVADDWGGTSQFLKDRTRRLVAKGQELMRGGYRELLA